MNDVNREAGYPLRGLGKPRRGRSSFIRVKPYLGGMVSNLVQSTSVGSTYKGHCVQSTKNV